MKKITILVLLTIFSIGSIHAQTITNLFQPRSSLSRSYQTVAREYQALDINAGTFSSLKSQRPASFQLSLPFNNSVMELDLERVQITTDNFSVVEALPNGGRRTVNYSDGIFYHGKIRGSENSVATISLIGDRVMGVIADNNGNIILGAVGEEGLPSEEYVLYRESALNVTNPMICGTSDEMVGAPASSHAGRVDAVNEPVEIYFECDNKFYIDMGSNTTTVINYVLGFFNNVARLYENEDIKVQVSQIMVWTTQDPEAATNLNTTGTILPAFATRMGGTNYIGDYAHFLTTRPVGGGIAYVLGNPCSSEKRLRSAVSGINITYSNFPVYSWTVQVVTHELGHNFGSNHTQWCGWTGGALDNCFQTEASPSGSTACPPGPVPNNGGTIMSYCHLAVSGINFANGFGVQPGDRIRNVLSGAACFGTCRMTIEIEKTDASCNQPNGLATVNVTNGTGAITYTWSNGDTGPTLGNVAPGTYHVTVKDASGCQVMKDVVIGNTGTTLNFSLTPNTSAGYCAGGNIVLNATNNPAYTYQWFNGTNPIGGATTSSYTASTPGNYSVVATSGACNGTQEVTVAVLAAPTATITPGGATTFCSGDDVVLDANIGAAYMYQWFNNDDPIPGATSGTYTATTSGSYKVRVSAGSTCQVVSAPIVVTVNPSPLVDITVTGPTNFCAGVSTMLTTNTGTGYVYQWYNGTTALNGETGFTYIARTPGSYHVVTTLGPCTRTSVSTNITVLPSPTVTVSPVFSQIAKSQTQTLTATGAEQYNWSSLPDMVSSTTTTGTYRPMSTTVYVVEGIASNGCRGTATATIEVVGCDPVTNITATVNSPTSVLIAWDNPGSVTTDTLQYRKVGAQEWIKIFVTGESHLLTDLDPISNYEYNIIPLCSTSTLFVPSATQTFTTPVSPNGRYVNLYPNPVTSAAQSRLEIITDQSVRLQVEVYDNTGKVVMVPFAQATVPAGQTIVPISGIGTTGRLANGLYLVSIMMDDKRETIKMLIVN